MAGQRTFKRPGSTAHKHRQSRCRPPRAVRGRRWAQHLHHSVREAAHGGLGYALHEDDHLVCIYLRLNLRAHIAIWGEGFALRFEVGVGAKRAYPRC
eukprot:scaffold88789_cov34-Tisochrysis_lutea.AAC.2